MLKLERLALAIATHEGWFPVGSSTHPAGSRAYRNHNPGNLRASVFECGNEGGYSVFKNDSIGWHALQYDLMQKAKGNTRTGLNGESTLRQLIYKWAPPSDGNDTEAYLEQVVLTTGMPATAKLKELLQD